MKVLFFATTDFYRKPNPSFHLMVSMIEDILDAGNQVCFIGIAEKGLKRHIPESIESREGIEFHLIEQTHVKRTSFVKRYLNGVLYALKARKLLKKYAGACDVLFVRSSPTVVFNLIFASKYKKNQKIILNIQDMFPGASIATGVMKNRFLQKLFYRLQKTAYKKSDCIVAISEDMKTKLIEEGVPAEKIHVIVNWYDDRTVHEVLPEDNRFIKKHKMSDNVFYVQYAGTMGLVFDCEMVMAVAAKLIEYPDICFQMIGEGSQKEAFMREASRRNLHNIVFLPLEPQEMVADVYSACSVCFIPLRKNVIGNCVPSKAALLMACKRPILTSADPESEYCNMINANKMGIAVSNEDAEAAAEAILYLYNNRAVCRKMGLNGFNFGSESYSRSLNMTKYLDLFKE